MSFISGKIIFSPSYIVFMQYKDESALILSHLMFFFSSQLYEISHYNYEDD
jgi:hypothetical protein